jgi:hypothetical protein
MSFFCPDTHEERQHAAFFEYTTVQGPLCLACFLASLADAAQLDSRKIFVLRYTQLPVSIKFINNHYYWTKSAFCGPLRLSAVLLMRMS